MLTAKVIPVSDEIVARFCAKVNRRTDAECWLWAGNRVRGYGQLAVRHNEPVYAHRLSWVIAHGPILHNHLVIHRCDVPACVNPNHLFLGSQLDNLRDASQKGRFHTPRTGKLTLADRMDVFFSVEPSRVLAQRYGMTQRGIAKVRRGEFVGAPPFQRVDPQAEQLHHLRQLLFLPTLIF